MPDLVTFDGIPYRAETQGGSIYFVEICNGWKRSFFMARKHVRFYIDAGRLVLQTGPSEQAGTIA